VSERVRERDELFIFLIYTRSFSYRVLLPPHHVDCKPINRRAYSFFHILHLSDIFNKQVI
jgi:hypothetical protein